MAKSRILVSSLIALALLVQADESGAQANSIGNPNIARGYVCWVEFQSHNGSSEELLGVALSEGPGCTGDGSVLKYWFAPEGVSWIEPDYQLERATINTMFQNLVQAASFGLPITIRFVEGTYGRKVVDKISFYAAGR